MLLLLSVFILCCSASSCLRSFQVEKPHHYADVAHSSIRAIATLGDSLAQGVNAELTFDQLRALFGRAEKPEVPFPGSSWTGNSSNLLPWLFAQSGVAVRGAGETPPFGTNVEDAQPSQLNVAQSGDRIEHLLSKVSLPRLNMSQFDILNFVMPQDLRSEWKLVNIMIGPNDVCSYCPDSGGPATGASGQQYLAEMRKVLAAFSSSFDYALVHVLPPFNVTLISQFSDVRCAVFLGSDCLLSVDICRIVHQSVCSCITSEGGRAEVNNQLAIIYDGLQNVVDEANAALNRSTIRFFYHPFLTKVGLSQSELQSLMAVDCFHLTYAGHSLFAGQVWNSLFRDSTSISSLNLTRICPLPQSRIRSHVDCVGRGKTPFNACPDVNGDQSVNLLDVVGVLDFSTSTDCPSCVGDLTQDERVNSDDLREILKAWAE